MSLLSGNQYLRPEYLSPLPTTLDAKKSPLALLAQTCSNIGADNPNHKPIIPGLEKNRDSEKNKDKSTNNEEKPAFKPYELSKKDSESSGEGDKKSPSSKSVSPVSPSPAVSTTGSCGKNSPSGGQEKRSHSATSCETGTPSVTTSTSTSLSASNSISGNHNTLSGLGYRSGASLGLDLGRSDSSKDGLGSLSHLSFGAYKHGLNGSLNPLANCVGCSPMLGHIPVDAATTAHTFPVTASQSGTGGLKPGCYTMGGLSPYVGYARVKTASGGTAFVPVCRDPSCMNCQLSMQSAQLGQCPSGCTQCTHERITPFGGTTSLAGLVPGLPGSSSPTAAGNPSALAGLNSQLYPHAMLPRPNVCSWMVGDTYCGKRFTSSEELLQHLRTHTNLSATDTASYLPMLSPSFSMPSAAGLGAAACHLHYSSAPSLTSPAGLRRTYPTSLSPVSSLSASRFHPYKPTLPTLPGAPMPPLPHPGLSMYYPYSLYGQRLGPPVHP